MSKYARKKDSVHNDIVAFLESRGCTCIDLSRAAHGVPDVLVGFQGRWSLLEIKSPDAPAGDKALTAAEQKLKDRCEAGRLPWFSCRSVAGAQMLLAQWSN